MSFVIGSIIVIYPRSMFPLSCACVTFRLARTAFSYGRTIGIGHECYCSRGRPMRTRRNKIRGNIVHDDVLSLSSIIIIQIYLLNGKLAIKNTKKTQEPERCLEPN